MKQIKLNSLKTTYMGRQCLYFEEVNSTNIFAKENADVLDNGCAVIAESQTMGRGRLGKRWNDDKLSHCDNLALTFLIKGDRFFKRDVSATTLAVGLATCNALESLTNHNFYIKWPNDIICNQHKICGILCEIVSKNSYSMACGIGINLASTKENWEKLGLPNASSVLEETGVNLKREDLASEISNFFEKYIETLTTDGFKVLRDKYKAKLINIGMNVKATKDGNDVVGKVVDVDNTGAIIIETKHGNVTVSTGVVSLRNINGEYV